MTVTIAELKRGALAPAPGVVVGLALADDGVGGGEVGAEVGAEVGVGVGVVVGAGVLLPTGLLAGGSLVVAPLAELASSDLSDPDAEGEACRALDVHAARTTGSVMASATTQVTRGRERVRAAQPVRTGGRCTGTA